MRLGSLLVLVLSLGGCAEPLPGTAPTPDRARFDQDVYPLLLRDCGFPACHGSPERFFRVFGPNRNRLDVNTALGAAATPMEIQASYDRARSMLAGANRAEDTLLLRRPLEIEAGGSGHMGIDEHGQDVYRTPLDPGYRTLLEWARTGGL